MPHLRDISSQVGAAAEPRDTPGFTSFVCLLTFSPKARGLARGRDPGRGQCTDSLLRAPEGSRFCVGLGVAPELLLGSDRGAGIQFGGSPPSGTESQMAVSAKTEISMWIQEGCPS